MKLSRSNISDLDPKHILVKRIKVLLATILAGSLWTVGYLVVPILFGTLEDKVLAGTIAGNLFQAEAWLSLVCGLVLVLLCKLTADKLWAKEHKVVLLLIVSMLACTLVGYFVLHPYMVDLRVVMREAVGPALTAAKTRFGLMHGFSSVMYLLESLLAVALILKIR
jgi:hypothetical protein